MKNVMFWILLIWSVSLPGQNIVNVKPNPACDQNCTGNAEIKIIKDLLDPDMLPPFEVYLVNVSTQESASYTINGYQGDLQGLCPGDYEITIHLSEYCTWIGNVHIQSVTEVPLNVSLIYSCNSRCVDIQVHNYNGLIEVSWFKLVQSSYVLLPGWPKYNLPGNDGQEDLCNITDAGMYKAVVYDATCGTAEATLRIDPCSCLSLDVVSVQNVTSCKGAEPDLFPPTPPYQACDGALSVSLNYAGPVDYKWSNGMTGGSIHNLCTGVYTVTATAGNCRIIRDFEICCCFSQFGDPPFNLCFDDGTQQAMTIYAYPSSPGNANTADGSIRITVQGGSSVKSYSWSGPDGFSSNSKDIYGLISGDYYVTVNDGCADVVKHIKLVNCEVHDYQITSSIIPACFNGSKGVLRINKPSHVSIIWDDPDMGSALNFLNLDTGIYCLTATDMITGCSSRFCYTVPKEELELGAEIIDITHTCGEESKASVSVQVNIRQQPFVNYHLFKLEDGQVTEFITSGFFNLNTNSEKTSVTISNLGIGTYLFLIFDRCETKTIPFDVGRSEIAVTHTFELGCENNSSATIMAQGDYPPFTYNWGYGLPLGPTQNNLKRQVYVVIVTDARGCTAEHTIEDLRPAVELVSKVSACTGLNDGQALIQVNNPNNEFTQIRWTYGACPDCPNFPVPVDDPFANPIQFSLGNLSGTQTYTIDVAIGDCFYRFNFTVGTDPSTRRYNHHEIIPKDKVLCHYDEICKDNEWLDQIVVPATLKAEEGKCEVLAAGLWGLFSNCGSYEYFCDNVKVHSKKVGTRIVRVGQWIEWIERTRPGVDISSFDFIGDLCSYMVVCENMPECRVARSNIHGFGGEKERVIDLGNGCFRIICKSIFFLIPAPDYTICGLDFLPDYIPFHYEPPPVNVPCRRMTKSFAEMVHFMPFLISEYGEVFTSSSLYTELLKYKNDPRKNCADITFCKCPDWADEERCKDNFKFLSSDINDVNCEVLDPAINDGNASVGATCVVFTNSSSDGKLDISYVWCKKKGDSVPRPRILNLVDYYKFWSSLRSGMQDVVNIIPDTIKTDVNFVRFGNIKIDSSYWLVDGIFSSSGKNFYHAFNLNEWEVNRALSAHHIYQDLSNGSGIMIAKEGDDYVFLSKTSESDSTKMLSLSSDNQLEILKVENVNDEYYIYVVNDGRLMMNRSAEICRSTPGDIAVLKLNIRNQSLGLEYLIQSDFAARNTFYSHKGKVYSIVPSGKTISVGAMKYTSAQKSTLISINSNNDGRVAFQEHLKFTENINMANLAQSEDGGIAYVMKGKGMVYDESDNLIYSETSTDKIVILSNAVLFKPIVIETQNVDLSFIPLTIDNQSNVYLGINFSDQIRILDSVYKSNGSKDIVITKFNRFGQLVMSRQYGSADEEILKDIRLAHDVLFMGGEIAGTTAFRSIGALTFAKFVPAQRHAFVTYDSFIENVALLDKNELENRKKTNITDFTIIPNPAQSFIEVKLDYPISKTHKLQITDLNGITHYSTQLNPNPINNESFGIDISFLPSGIYIIYVTDPNGHSIPKKFIKLQH